MTSNQLYPHFSRRKAFCTAEEILYSPLINPSTYIRVVTIHPAEEDALIACSLESVALEDAVFEALSYCWGDEVNPKHIYLNHTPHSVTSNLHSALKALRDRVKPRRMWIDAICINQKDNEERSRQVEIMGSIYASAKSTIVWLGPSIEGTKEAFAFLRFVEEFGHEDEDVEDFLSDRESLSALLDILQRPYWSRLWIVQEMILSKEVTVQCGKFEIPSWDIVSFGRSELCEDLKNQIKSLDPLLQEIVRFFFGSFSTISLLATVIAKMDDDELKDYAGLSFYELLHFTQCHQCRDPRDKLYGVLSLTALHRVERHFKIRPDYNLSVSQVYQNFISEHITWSKSLMMLEKAGLQRHAIDVSWVPDLTYDGWYSRYVNKEGIHKACGELTADCDFSEYGKLSTQGLHCDTVAQTKQFGTADSFAVRLEEWLDIVTSTGVQNVLETFLHLVIDVSEDETDELIPLVIGFCLSIGDMTASSEGITEPPRNTFLEYYNLYSKKWARNSPLSDQEKLRTFLDDFPSLAFVSEWPTHVLPIDQSASCVHNFATNSRFDKREIAIFVTTNGYVGCSGITTSIGDHVFVLPGGTNPFLLRQKSGQYLLVDYCFVQGMMQGEMVEKWQKGDLSMQEITII